jgi:hypothetical protein
MLAAESVGDDGEARDASHAVKRGHAELRLERIEEADAAACRLSDVNSALADTVIGDRPGGCQRQ